jgi:hypothetical protein
MLVTSTDCCLDAVTTLLVIKTVCQLIDGGYVAADLLVIKTVCQRIDGGYVAAENGRYLSSSGRQQQPGSSCLCAS